MPDDDVAAALHAAFGGVVKDILAEILPRIFTGPSMQALINNLLDLNRSVAALTDATIDLRVTLGELQEIKRSGVRTQQLDMGVAQLFRDQMRVQGCSEELIQRVVLEVLATTHHRTTTPGAVQTAARRVMRPGKSKRKQDDKR